MRNRKPWKRATDPQFIASEKYANDVIAKETERQYMKVRRTQKKLVVELVVVLEIVREEGEKNEKDLGNPMQETNLDYLTRWMVALRNLNSESRIKTSSPKPLSSLRNLINSVMRN